MNENILVISRTYLKWDNCLMIGKYLIEIHLLMLQLLKISQIFVKCYAPYCRFCFAYNIVSNII